MTTRACRFSPILFRVPCFSFIELTGLGFDGNRLNPYIYVSARLRLYGLRPGATSFRFAKQMEIRIVRRPTVAAGHPVLYAP